MNAHEYTTMRDVLQTIPDPRKARGQRYPWLVLLTLITAGLASDQQAVHAISHWLELHTSQLHTWVPQLTRMPSESTLLRALRWVDVTRLEAAMAGLTAPQTSAEQAAGEVVTPAGTRLQAQAVDGKTLRGATACGPRTHMVRLVQHGSGVTLAQVAVAQKRNESSAVPGLVAERD